ncbi:MAG TPA: GldG family protein [Bryobacteraceae bacterium]|nr:GldG family protein [Bryobacteraceae bacterium]
MKADWIKARQTKYSAYVTIYILVILAVLGVANFLANRYDKSYDATANKQFSLSEQTVKAVKGLKKDVTVTYFGETTNFPQARDLLGRYANLSSKLKVGYIDPVKKPQLARAAGVRQEGTIVVDTGLRKEDAKTLDEQDITGALIRAEKGGERTACFLSGSGEHSLDDSSGAGFSALKDALEHNNYKTRSVNLEQPEPLAPGAAPVIGKVEQAKVEIPKDCSVLVSGGPKLAYSAAEVAAIKAYVEGGGSALFLMDTPLRIGSQEGTENPEVVKMLADWGVTMDNDLALDTSGIGQIFGLGPEVVMVTTYESQPIVRDFKEGMPTAIPLSRTLKINGNTKVTVDKLLSTSDNSFATSNVSGAIDPKKGVKGPLVLAAAGTYNTGKSGASGRFVVFGSSQWAVNNFLGSRSIVNRDLALNTFNWLTSDEDLISIRPKAPEDRRLNITGNRMSMIFWWSVVLLPLTVVGAGLMVWWRRR